MRRRARRDANHDEVVRDLRRAGFSVLETHQLGDDKPDLVVGGYGMTGLVELKSGGSEKHKDRVARQQAYLETWAGGLAFVASSSSEILQRFAVAALQRAVR